MVCVRTKQQQFGYWKPTGVELAGGRTFRVTAGRQTKDGNCLTFLNTRF